MANAYKCDHDILTANDDGKRQGPIKRIYIHTFEGRDLDAIAMARYQLSPAAGGSYHMVIDANGMTARENDDEFIPWSAGWTANRDGIHISLAGQAAFTRDHWLSRDKQMSKLADIVATYCKAYGVPAVYRNAGDLKAGKWGISTHAAAAIAWRETDHTDPGGNFPMSWLVDQVNRRLRPAATPPQAATPAPTPGDKYPSLIDGRELRLSEYVRFVDEKLTRIYDELFPEGQPMSVNALYTGMQGDAYPSYVDNSKSFTLDQYLRLIDFKVDAIAKEMAISTTRKGV